MKTTIKHSVWIWMLCVSVLLAFHNVEAKQVLVTGTVNSSESGEPIPGVNIILERTSTGTTTDPNGNFELEVPSLQETLVFTYIGYERLEVSIEGRTELNIELTPSIIAGDEVVVIGYGTVSRRDMTGSVSQIESESISRVPVPRLDQALQGKSAGVKVTSLNGEPGSGTSIRIRGGNSISASNEPLYVIDGFIGGGDLNSINPSDIESIEILKDASATAIYGSRGANGVVLITTKQGRAGDVQVSLQSSMGWQKLANKIDFLNGPELAEYQNEASGFVGREIPFSDLNEVEHYDWIDAITQTAPVNEFNLSIAGGSENTQYFISGNALTQDGIVKSSGFNRYQSRLNLNNQVKDWLDINVLLNISRTNRMNNVVSMSEVLTGAHTYMPFYQNGGSYTFINPSTGFPFNNPIAQANLETDKTFRTRLQSNVEAIIQPLENMEITSRFGADLNSVKVNEFEPGALPLRQDQDVGAFGSVVNNVNWNILSENTINYEHNINDNNHFDVLGGFTFQHYENESSFLSASNIPSDALSFNSLQIGDPNTRNINTGFSEWTMLSYLGRFNYRLMDRYLVTFTSRLDGSSRLAENNKWAFFPSGAVAWQIGSEPFMQDLDFINELKLRLSFGKTGNQAIDVYQSLASLAQTTTFFGESSEQVAFQQGNLPNPNLKWETTDQYNIGLDASILNNRLSFVVEYYYKRTKDLLLTREIPFQTGYQNKLENIGEVENKGLEFAIDASIIQGSDFLWNLELNIAGNRNKVLDLGGRDFIDLGTGARLVVGEVGASFVGLVYEGTWKSQEEIDANPDFMPDAEPGLPRFRDVNGNGTFDGEGDYGIIGNYQPDFFGGFSNSFQYRNWSMDADFHYSYGNQIFNRQAGQYFFGRHSSNLHAMVRDRWTQENPDSDIPRAGSEVLADFREPISATVQDGSFLRLKNVRVEYTLPAEIIGWMGANSRASIYFTGSNLFVLHNYDFGWDPEVSSRGNDPVQQGFDSTTYPPAKTYVVGINFDF